jgi:hypothetical protein
VVFLFLIIGCGGDGGGGNTDTSESTGTISGSVSGTTIMALDDDGMILATDNTKRRLPDLDIDGDNIDESYSFILSEVPVGKKIRIYLVTNEDVYPVFFEDSGYNATNFSHSSDTNNTNIFSLTSATNIDIGFIDVMEEVAIPEKNPLLSGNVKPEGADTQRKAISGATIDDFVGKWSGLVRYDMDEEDDCPEGDCSDETDDDPCDPESGKADIVFTLDKVNEQLTGSIHENKEGWTANVLNPRFENDAAFKFDLANTDPGNPDCEKWSVSFTATLKEDGNGELNIMDLQGGGIFCGCDGGTTGTFWDDVFRQ